MRLLPVREWVSAIRCADISYRLVDGREGGEDEAILGGDMANGFCVGFPQCLRGWTDDDGAQRGEGPHGPDARWPRDQSV